VREQAVRRGPLAWPHSAAVALQLLTRVPVRLRHVDDDDLRRSVAFFPAVGLLVAAAGIATRWAVEGWIGLPAATVLAVAVMVLMTGAFHEDGLADSADASGRGTPREIRFRSEL
jgi:adenosylcobinamide-GDP ribazoletransferase